MLVEIILVLKVAIVILLLLLPVASERVIRLRVLVEFGSLAGLPIRGGVLLRSASHAVECLVAKRIVLLA